MNEEVYNKTGMSPSGANLDALMSGMIKNGLMISKISHSKLKMLIAMDDWGTVAKYAAPAIMKFGEEAIEKLWNRYKPSIMKFLGHDIGLDEDDYRKDPVRQPSIISENS